MAYYNTGNFGNNQYQPFGPPGATGGFFGTMPVGPGTFQSNPLFGGNSSFYDTANNGAYGYEQFVNQATGQNGQSTGGRFGNWLRSRFGTVSNQYGAAQAKDPTLSFSQYLTNNQGNLQDQYQNQNPYDKGEQGQRGLRWL